MDSARESDNRDTRQQPIRLSLGIVASLALSFILGLLTQSLITNYFLIPRHSGVVAQRLLDEHISSRQATWTCNALWYFRRLEFHGDRLSVSDVEELLPIVRSFEWIELIDVSDTSLSQSDAEVLEEMIPGCIVLWDKSRLSGTD